LLGASCVVDTALKVHCETNSDCIGEHICVASVCQPQNSPTMDGGMKDVTDPAFLDASGDDGPEASSDAPQGPPPSGDARVEAGDATPETSPPADASDGATGATDAPDAGKPTEGHPNYAFITSGTTRTRFTPLDVADAFCQDAADEAQLPGTYRAWISDNTATVIDRFKGTRGWVRTDGLPFADTLADLIAGRILYPLGLDERGKRVIDERDGYDGRPVTGTTVDGSLDFWNSCIRWTSTDNTIGRAAGGYANAGGPLWDTGNTIVCSYEVRLICLGIDKAVPVSAALAPTMGRVGFITEKTWASGKGIGSADALCGSEAAAAKLPGTFKAVLASTTTSLSERLRMPNHNEVWMRPDGVALTSLSSFGVAASFLGAAWNVTAAGKYVTDLNAFVGAPGLGLGTGNQNCQDWTSTSSLDRAVAAEILRPDIWTDGLSSIDCATQTRIMCLQDPPSATP
jgi:hypothetical protein